MTAPNRLKKAARELGLGVLIYKLLYAPRNALRTWNRWGIVNSASTYVGKVAMEKAVFSLQPVNTSKKKDKDALDVYFMTGCKYWYQTCFCIYSMQLQTGRPLHPIIYDDSSLGEKHIREITRLFPSVEIVSFEDTETKLDRVLPKNKFPTLRERRIQQPLLRKLTDFHAGEKGWKLFLDSDMLFFKDPTFLISWLQSPRKPCYMIDVGNFYGYSEALLNSLAQSNLPDKVNIGILGLQSESIDWEKLEHWLRTLIKEEGTHYNVTQGLSAMILSNYSCIAAPEKDYLLMPCLEEAKLPTATMHHYVADSKPSYFRYGWRHFV